MIRSVWPAAAALLLLAGCAATPVDDSFRWPASGPAQIELDAVPFFPQRDYQCGPAALATVLAATGLAVTADELVPQVYLPARHGSLQAEMLATVRRHERLPYLLEPRMETLLREVAAGRPVLVLQNLGVQRLPIWHYAVVVGYDRERARLVLRSGVDRRDEMRVRRFVDTWRRAAYWAVVVLEPGQFPERPEPIRYLEATAGLEQAGRLESAERAYAAATQRWPVSGVAWLGLANVRMKRGDSRGAEQGYRAALAREPRNAAARNNLAYLLAQRGCFDAAELEVAAARDAAAGTSLLELVDGTAREIMLMDAAAPARSDAPDCAALP